MSLISSSDNLNDIRSILISTLVRAGNDKNSGFRFITLNTIADDFPNSRYVVLRKFESENNEVFIYTDYRSNKIKEIRENPSVSVLAYDKQKRFQIKLKAEAKIHHQDDISEVHWSLLQGGKESYNTKNQPGEVTDSLQKAHQMKNEINDQYFAVLKLQLIQAEVLQLNKEGHIRALFDFRDNTASFLVP